MWAWLKKAIGGATGLCVPDASQNVTLTPPAARGTDSSSFLGAHASQERSNSSKHSLGASAQDDLQDHTPLPLAISNGRAEADMQQQQQAAGKDTRTEEDQTPPMQMMPSADRYIVSGGMVSTCCLRLSTAWITLHVLSYLSRVKCRYNALPTTTSHSDCCITASAQHRELKRYSIPAAGHTAA